MIYLNEKTNDAQKFENLLQRVKELALEELKLKNNVASTLSGNEFELIVFNQCEKAAIGTDFEGKLVHTEDRVFPDIIAAGFFGIEVKATKKDAWISIGNSVLESSRIADVSKIYMFFGKLGGSIDIVFRDYESCLKAIAVTHYPRYLIDMNLPEGKSIFELMKISYDEIRQSENPIKHIRKYYKNQLKEGQKMWWIDDDSDEIPGLSPVIQYFSMLDADKKESLKAEAFILFPEILSRTNTKFEKVAAHWASEYGLVSSSLRDNFTAGGQVEIKVRGQKYTVPQIVNEFIKLARLINQKINDQEKVDLARWKQDIDSQANDMKLTISMSLIYEAALAGEIE